MSEVDTSKIDGKMEIPNKKKLQKEPHRNFGTKKDDIWNKNIHQTDSIAKFK